MNNTTENFQFTTSDISLASFLMAKNAKYIDTQADNSGHCSFSFEDENFCNDLKREFLNGGEVKAQELLNKREILISEMKTKNRNGEGYGKR